MTFLSLQLVHHRASWQPEKTALEIQSQQDDTANMMVALVTVFPFALALRVLKSVSSDQCAPSSLLLPE